MNFCALGPAGRYLGGQATHQGQRFWARGEDPDQFAGWFGQSNSAWQHPLLSIQRQCWRKIYLETIEVADPACSVKASMEKADRGDLFDQN
jgi:hypothetical protein